MDQLQKRLLDMNRTIGQPKKITISGQPLSIVETPATDVASPTDKAA